MIVDDVRRNPDDPKRDMDTHVFVVAGYKFDFPGLRFGDGSRYGCA